MTEKPDVDHAEDANARVEAAVKRKRAQRPFPACPFEEALEFARATFEYGSGKAVRRLSLFDHLKKSPESGASRQLIVNANKYDLIKGGYAAEQLELTPDAIRAIDEEIPKREQAKAWIQLAITGIEPFKQLYDRFAGNKLPARAALIDAIKEFDVPAELAEEAVDTFVVNLRFTGLLQTLSGAERIVTSEHLLDTLPATPMRSASSPQTSQPIANRAGTGLVTSDHAQF